MAKEKPNQSHELPGTDFRPRVAETLESGSYKRAVSTPYRTQGLSDMERTIYRLEKEYDSALETQKAFQLLRSGEKAPDFDQVMKIFTPEMLVAAQSFQNPTLTLSTKGRSFNDLVSAMDGHRTMPDQRDTYVDKLYQKHAAQKPENWGAHIIEAPTDVAVQDFDDIDLILGKRLKRFASHKKATGVNGMDRFKYAQLIMQSLKEGKPIDAKYTWTMLDSDPALSTSRIPHAYCAPCNREVGFTCIRPVYQRSDVRFRRSVGGIVPNA